MELQYDLPITIYTAARRFEKRWKRTETTWAHLLERLSHPVRTGETAAEYRKMKKSDRDAKKDSVGGFVGGTLKDGRRLKQNVLTRQIVTLDADNAEPGFLESVRKALGGCAWAVYSTHSHRPEAPRLRVLVLLASPVGPEAYQAIARRLAADVGIETMDDTTYEPERLMFWPSTPQDGEYVFEHNDAPPLEPEAVLARYENWQDVSQWPTSRRETDIVRRTAKKQGDPLAKEGIIGAFCRAHPIGEAIETFLADVYAPCGEGRYTYLAGSTTGGLVLYEDRFAYSHHSTDPAGGRLCNAFDLVRIHLFGALDEDSDAATPANKLPSFVKMSDFARKDKATAKESRRELTEELKKNWEDGGSTSEDTEWMDSLEADKKGNLLPSARNFIQILSHDPLLAGRFGRDDFAHRFMVRGDLPWREAGQDLIWRDSDDACLRNYLSVHYKLQARQVIDDALTEVMAENAFHPVRDYLSGLRWDGVPRAETVYIDWLGADDCSYVRAVTRIHLKAAVARVMRPGVKFDQCLVLSGPQGIGKSTVLRLLGKDWFNDGLVTFQGKDPMEQLQGAWINELSEMQATSKAENDQIKAFLSRNSDRFRAPYGRRTEEFPRQCVFAATTNDAVFLKDRTGGRRFWPIFCHGDGKKDLEELTTDYVDQVWAEVRTMYEENESLLLPADAVAEARELQEAHTEGSEKVGLISDYLDKKLPENWDSMDIYERREYLEHYGEDGEPAGTVTRRKVCTLEIWCEIFGGTKKDFTNANARELNGIMQSMAGWRNAKSIQTFGNLYGKQRAFIRADTE